MSDRGSTSKPTTSQGMASGPKLNGLSSNIVKGGALIDDTTRFVLAWDHSLTPGQNLDRVVKENLLGLPSRSRASDIACYAFAPRFVRPGPEVVKALRTLLPNRPSFVDACYYEATRADALLARFAQEAMMGWYAEGRRQIDVGIVRDWLSDIAVAGIIPIWADTLTQRVAQGLIATLRDFGRLHGARRSQRKEIVQPGTSIGGFAYVAYRLHQQGESSRAILSSEVWTRWLLNSEQVDELMHRLASLGIVYYSVAGSVLRIDWRVESLQEIADATT